MGFALGHGSTLHYLEYKLTAHDTAAEQSLRGHIETELLPWPHHSKSHYPEYKLTKDSSPFFFSYSCLSGDIVEPVHHVKHHLKFYGGYMKVFGTQNHPQTPQKAEKKK